MCKKLKQRKKLHRLLASMKEVAEGIVIGLVVGVVLVLVFLIYCRMAGPLW